MPTYALNLEHGPRRQKTMVHVPALLGCIAKGATTDTALTATPDAIRGYLRFLHRHGEGVNPDDPFETEVAEEITEGYFLGNGSASILFQSDLQPLSADEVETYVRRYEWMRAAVLERVGTLAPDALEAKLDEKERAVREILVHLLESGNYYVWGTLGKVKAASDAQKAVEKGSPDILDHMAAAHRALVERLRAMTPPEREQVVNRGKEVWTARKSFRRLLEHEWEHLLEIAGRVGKPV
jgi:predicted RNase H-like HicB family nuclease/uncharacterized damage-inducible protein DinB